MLLKYKEGTGHTDPAGPFDRSDVFFVLFLVTFNYFAFLVLELELVRVLMLVPVLVLVLPMFLWLQQQ